jgi:1-acyl-sn-glycerol-3-phosphate acyltransferase
MMDKIKNIAGKAYLIWSGTWFIGSFLLLYPFFMLCITLPGMKKYSVAVNKVWCWIFFPASFLRVHVIKHFSPSSNQTFVFCPNHSSYLDIPVLTYVLPGYFAFLGKEELARIPLFGFMFRSFHITVNRRNAADRYASYQRSLEVVRAGRSIVIFPEGRIKSEIQPGLDQFKDGAFRIAIDAQIPIIPVSLPNNWRLLPDDGTLRAGFGSVKVILHHPIPTKGCTYDDIPMLKAKVHEVLLKDIEEHNKKYLTPKKEKHYA